MYSRKVQKEGMPQEKNKSAAELGKKIVKNAGKTGAAVAPVVLKTGVIATKTASTIGCAILNGVSPGAGTGASIGVETALAVVDLATTIYAIVQKVRANKSQAKRLGERITSMSDAIKGLESDYLKEENFTGCLHKFKNTLEQIQDFLEAFAKENWLERIIYVMNDGEKFSDFQNQLNEHIKDLNLSLTAHNVVSQQELKNDLEQDRIQLQTSLQQIIASTREVRERVIDIGKGQDEIRQILNEQLKSMQTRYEAALNNHNISTKYTISPHLIVEFFDLFIQRKLGDKGKTYYGKLKNDEVAIKIVEDDLTEAQIDKFIREIQIVSRLNGENIVKIRGVCLNDTRKCLITEYMHGGTLSNYIQTRSITISQREQFIFEITRGLINLHSNEIFHRDLTPENIFISKYGEAKIGGLGLAKIHNANVKTVDDLENSTCAYLAPEILQGKNRKAYTDKADIYSLGTIMWMLFTNKQPYRNLSEQQISKKILAGEHESVDQETIPDSYKKLIKRCWSQNPLDRPTLADIHHIFNTRHQILLDAIRDDPTLELQMDTNEILNQARQNEADKKYKSARIYYWLAARQGSLSAQTSLAALYLQHGKWLEDSQQLKNEAYILLLCSAQHKHSRAYANLGIQFEMGDGIAKNIQKASFWYQKGVEQKEKTCIMKLNELIKNNPDINYTLAKNV